MNRTAIVLYFIGLLGVFLSLLMLAFKIHKKRKIFNIIILLIILISFSSLGAGTILSLIEIKNSSDGKSIDELTNNYNLEVNKHSLTTYDDLSLIYKISSSGSSNYSTALITIENNSSYIFSGEVTLKLLDENKSVISSLVLPINNLAPNGDTESHIQVNSNTSSIEYSFSGEFKEDTNSNLDSNYTIKSIWIGDDFISFEVVAKDNSVENLKQISNEFKELYNKKICKSFLVYFIDSEDLNFNKAYADFFGDNEKDNYVLTTFSTNEKYKIR